MSLDIQRFSDAESLYAAGEGLLREAFTRSYPSPAGIMLSGGGTPLEVYRRLASNPPASSENLHLLFSDERHVPGDSPENNRFQAQPMIQALGIPADRVLSVDTTLLIRGAADDYHIQLDRFLARGGTIPVGLLGIGGDGHTASLFALADVAAAGDSWAIPVERPTPPHRISVTPRLLEQADRLIFWVIESGKEDAIHRLIHDPQSIPAGLAIQTRTQTELWLA